MAFRFKKATCVVAGTFNMYIVQPAWLAKVGIIPKGIEVAIGMKLDEPGLHLRSAKLRSRWFVTPKRIEVESDSPEEDCGEIVAGVLAALPWTPLVAMGNNAIYAAELSELIKLSDFALMMHDLGIEKVPEKIPSEYALAQKTFHLGLKKGDHLFNLQIAITETEVEIAANVHTELGKRDSQFAQATARKFLEHRRESEALIGKLLKASIDHGTGNSEPK